MNKKTYKQPTILVVGLESTEILARSNERLGDGGNIFGSGAKGMNLDEEWED